MSTTSCNIIIVLFSLLCIAQAVVVDLGLINTDTPCASHADSVRDAAKTAEVGGVGNIVRSLRRKRAELPPALSGDFAHAALCKTKDASGTDVYLLTVTTDSDATGKAEIAECNAVDGDDLLVRASLTLAEPKYTISGIVKDASNLSPIKDAFVYFVSDPSINYTTGADGVYTFKGLKNGTYEISYSANDYVTNTVNVVVHQNTVLDAPLSAVVAAGVLRIVTTWGNNSDIDSYLFLGNECILSYANTACSCGGGLYEVDDIDGFGPETITTTNLQNCTGGPSIFKIHALSVAEQSTVDVKLYSSAGLLGQWSRHTSVIRAEEGALWRVFIITFNSSGNIEVTTV